MKSSAQATVPTTKQFSQSESSQAGKDIINQFCPLEKLESSQAGKDIINQQSLCQVTGGVVTIEINPGFCRHHAKGFCKQRGACQFSHNQENCPDHGYSKTCENKTCLLRHPDTCKHFLKSRCFFGEKCHFFHPPEANPKIMHSMVDELQVKVDTMTRELSNMKEKIFMENKKPKPPDPTEIVNVTRSDMENMCKKVLEIFKKDMTELAKEIRLDLMARLSTIKVSQTSVSNDDIAQAIEEMKHDIKDKYKEVLEISKDDITEVAKKIRLDLQVQCSQVMDNTIRASEVSEDNTKRKIGVIQQDTTNIFSRLSRMETDHLRKSDDIKEALEVSKDYIAQAAKEIRLDLKDICQTLFVNEKDTNAAIKYTLKEKGKEDNPDTRAQIVIMERNDFVYIDEFLTAVASLKGCYAAIFYRDRKTYGIGYIEGIDLKEQLIYLTDALMIKEVHGSQKIIVFKSIKKQM
eukprot:GFUD01039101.1.p1 GENE.GFUD01039101.1~~GFUD01039101.1.p1  ORF type:complete len:463 (-),score=103.13 GFUD01039101.1:300-1688(-)